MNVGKLFEREIRQFLEKHSVLLVRQYDILGERFSSKKVFDFVALSPDGYFIGVEAKATRQGKWDFIQIKPHQREALTTVAYTEHGESFLALNFRGKKTPGRAWYIPWGLWLAFEEQWPRKSIKLEEAIEQFTEFELRRITRGWE